MSLARYASDRGQVERGLSLLRRAGPGRAGPMSIGGRCVTVSAVRKRTSPAKRPGNDWPIPLFDATAQPGVPLRIVSGVANDAD